MLFTHVDVGVHLESIHVDVESIHVDVESVSHPVSVADLVHSILYLYLASDAASVSDPASASA